jgi:calcineurin-like phosphoesterase family protein
MIWFTADTHFSHANIIKHCDRPFGNAEEMDKLIIDNFNSVIKKDDWVFYLGDFSFKDAPPFLSRLNGIPHLIRGNHDVKNPTGFKWVKDTFMLKVSPEIKIFMSHYGHRIWPNSHHGAIHLYGHSHGKLPEQGRSFDVGVDTNNFMPYSLYDVLRKVGIDCE